MLLPAEKIVSEYVAMDVPLVDLRPRRTRSFPPNDEVVRTYREFLRTLQSDCVGQLETENRTASASNDAPVK